VLAGGLLVLGLGGLLACSPPPPAATPAPAPPPAPPPALACPAPTAAPVYLRREAEAEAVLLSLSPDGKRLAILDAANHIQLRNVRTGELLIELDTAIERQSSRDGSRGLKRLDWGASSERLGAYYLDQIDHRQDRVFLWDLIPSSREPEASPNRASPASLLHAEASVIFLTGRTLRLQRRAPEGAGDDPAAVEVNDLKESTLLADKWPLALGVATLVDGQLRAFDPRTLAPRGSYQATERSQYTSSPDGRLFVGQDRGLLQLFDTATGKLLLEDGSRQGVAPRREPLSTSVAFDLAHQRIAVGYGWGLGPDEAEIWELSPLRRLRRWTLDEPSSIFRLQFSSDGSALCTRLPGNECRLWDIATGHRLGKAQHRPEPIEQERIILGAPANQRYPKPGPRVEVLEGSQRRWVMPSGGAAVPTQQAFTSPDGRQTALLSGGKTHRFFLLRPGEAQISFPAPEGEVTGFAFGPPGATFVSFGHEAHTMTFWDPQTLRPLGGADAVRGVHTARWSPDGKLLAVADLDDEVSLWADRAMIGQLSGIAAVDLRFTGDAAALVALGRDGSLVAWNLATRQHGTTWNFGLGARFDLADTAGPGREVVVHSSTTSEIVLVDVETGAQRRQPDCLPGAQALALGLSPRGHSLLLAASTGPGALCDLTTGQLVSRLAPGEASARSSVAYDLSGTRVATAADEGEGSLVRVRDTASGHVLVTLDFPDSRASALGLLFDAAGLVVRHDRGVSFYPLKGCAALDLQLVERSNELGWLVTDRTGHFDGDGVGRATAWVRDPAGRDLDLAEREAHQLAGLLFGAHAVMSRPPEPPEEPEIILPRRPRTPRGR
jgi:WD40 repeat protein